MRRLIRRLVARLRRIGQPRSFDDCVSVFNRTRAQLVQLRARELDRYQALEQQAAAIMAQALTHQREARRARVLHERFAALLSVEESDARQEG